MYPGLAEKEGKTRFCLRHDTCNRGILANSSLSAPSLPPLCGSPIVWSISCVCNAVNVAIWSNLEALHWSLSMVTRMIAAHLLRSLLEQ